MGFLWTLAISASALAIALAVGVVIGIGRTVPIPAARWICGAYVEIFRNVPLLVQMFLWFFVLPEVVPSSWGRWLKRDLFFPEFSNAVLCLGFYTASRIAEQVRAGIQSVSVGLSDAGLSMGHTRVQLYRLILLPICFRIVLPPLTTEAMGIFKNSSLALTIGMLELTGQSRQISEYTFASFEAFTAATLLYMIVSLSVLSLTHILDRKFRRPGAPGARFTISGQMNG